MIEDGTSSDEDEQLCPPGYESGCILEYYKLCNDARKKKLVDCRQMIKVYVEINPHEIKTIDDQKEEFQVLMMMKLWWKDPHLKNLRCTLRMDSGEDITGTIVKFSQDGNIVMKCKDGRTRTFKKSEYVSKHIQEPDWDKQFFPSFTFINIQGECNDLFKPIYEVVWSDQDGTFVSWRRKIDGTFAERLELHYFPLDRQLCRIKITAEKPIEDFQFVMLKKDHKHHFSRACDTFKVDQEMQKLCGSYVRYCDFELPFPSQRSMVNVIFHLDRQGDYYFNNMLLMVFLVNLMGLCAFAIPLHDASGRLSLVSSCFLAVLAYRYIINEILPRKAYLTAADKYITFACMFLIVICLQTVVFVIWRRGIEEVKEGQLSLASLWTRSTLDFYDYVLGVLMFIVWVAINGYLWCLWKLSRRQDWGSVYLENEEPYAPIQECQACGLQWLSKQCLHMETSKCPDPSCGSSEVQRKYLTPKQHPDPLVPEQYLPESPHV